MTHTPEEITDITNLLTIIKRISLIYRKGNNSQKSKVFDTGLVYTEKLKEYGYPTDLTESLLMFGEEFLAIPSMIDSIYYRTYFPEAYQVFNL